MIKNAYSQLSDLEKLTVDQYVKTVEIYANRNNEQIAFALERSIPKDIVDRSRGILERPLVLAAVYEKIKELANIKDLHSKRVLREHILIANSNMADYLTFDEFQNPKIDLTNCTREQLAAVKTVRVNHSLMGVKVEIELHSKIASLDALTKMLGLDQPDNAALLERINKPKDILQLSDDVTPEIAEKSYMDLLESLR